MKTELSKGIRKDTLLFDIKLGDHKKTFFDRCMELNKKGLVTQGPSNKYAKYMLYDKNTTSKTNDIVLLFYPTNTNSSIIDGMDLKFYYSAWSPWNKKLYNNRLLTSVKDTLLKWFPGNDFIQVKLKNDEKFNIKIDGNRQIKVSLDKNTKDVNVLIEDLKKKYNVED
ncbi:hypothetical protein [Aurantibacter sp.]|uniref:hypothetical protein n=1 Tax=Aurantibacter sp. TaxID=2807103 RepID=UPI0032649A5C